MKYEQGQKLKNREGDIRTVLGICGEVVHVSQINMTNRFFASYTEAELEESGYTLIAEPWEPKKGERYWHIRSSGIVDDMTFSGNVFDDAVRNYTGIFRTREQAEARLEQVRKALAGIV